MNILSRVSLPVRSLATGLVVLSGLYLTSLYSYLLFHSLVELFSIVVACGIFMIAWNSRRFIDNNYLLFVGIAFLFVSVFSLLHTLAYKGMDIFQGYGTNLPTQLWIVARYVGSSSLLIAPLFLARKLKPHLVFTVYTVVTVLLLLSIFAWGIFPDCYIDGQGLTRFKIVSEYIISFMFFASLLLLVRKWAEFDRAVLWLLILSIALRMGSELTMMAHVDENDLANTAGHFLRMISFYLFYKALIETGLVKPYDLLFRNLKKSEEALRQELDRVQHYLDVAGVMFVVIRADQTVELINKKGCEILGYSEGEIIGKNWFETFIPERMRNEVRQGFMELTAGNVDPMEYFENSVLTRSGEERIIAWHNAVLKDGTGKVVATLSSGEDISERRKAEERLARKTAELERSNAELEHFAAVVSHDLKEPLTTIGGFAELLRERYQDKLDARGQRLLENIVSGALRMEMLISDLLAYARVNTSAKPFKPVHCGSVIGMVLANLRAAIDESDAVITFDELPNVMGDEVQFVQLFQNLIGNAIKYRSDKPPRIHISARPMEETAFHSELKTGWLFSVADNGIGIDPANAERVFQIFHRLHRDDKYPGTGIGLAVCKKIVERHGGRIWVESEPGKGATFYFTVP
jgi:PAS domain S-box-containing protein